MTASLVKQSNRQGERGWWAGGALTGDVLHGGGERDLRDFAARAAAGGEGVVQHCCLGEAVRRAELAERRGTGAAFLHEGLRAAAVLGSRGALPVPLLARAAVRGGGWHPQTDI